MKLQDHRAIAKIGHGLLRILAATAVVFLGLIFSTTARAQTSKHSQAKAQFAKAQAMRQTLEAEPRDDRSLQEYKKLVTAYRKVYLLTPSAPETTEALFAVAEVYHDMGDLFDSIYYKTSVVTYRFLLDQYPANKHRSDALFAIGQIDKDDLHATADAKDAFAEYLRRFPRTPQADEARKDLQEIVDEAGQPVEDADSPGVQQTSDQLQSAKAGDTSVAAHTAAEDNAVAKPGDPSSVMAIRTWNADDYSRIVVDLNGAVKYEAARIKHPDRIYFDLYKARLGHSVTDKELPVQNGFLRSVRVAQNKSGVVRLVLDVQSIEGYSVFLLPNPYRLVIDVHGSEPAISKAKTAPVPEVGTLAGDRPAQPPAEKVAVPASGGAPSDAGTDSANNNVTPRRNLNGRVLTGPAVAAKPTRDGERSLTRALGLKISRIVIDPGHGGHDTGTIGPHGVLEKNICLDVALRLGKLIQKKLPGAEVVYTRKTDVFVPLEERTAIANQAKADLFISIHANSSHDHEARGIETYYLNFTSSPEALEVASRENALSDSSIHELQDLIKQIARNDKVEESRELATDIQDSLTHQLRLISTAEKNRGVKKAPFVVLIGADMPSVLAEISFLSNKTDERMLEKPTQREKIAQGIFRGVESYLSSLNSLNYNKPKLLSDRQSSGAETDRNQK
ncbi:MAG TPA: N-acetylmuramoyl-L-alanine amidase [Candidatus Acidoferrales bacterium]|nr:N-acetylmuramoyl-L-alanine amidase [Candidatus Acidoferrales bacterium]